MSIDKIEDKEIVFVTTTLYTKWLSYQKKLIRKNFPGSEIIESDGRNNWPVSWFSWINLIKDRSEKYYVHLDEDFFITSGEELRKCIQKIHDGKIDILGVSDAYHHYRGANPIAINTFLMIGRIDDLKETNLSDIQFNLTESGWTNNKDLHFKEDYLDGFEYPFEKQQNEGNFEYQQEPYYAFMWEMKNKGCKFGYLYPYFDDRFKSTNPRLTQESPDIGIHMWYTRQCESNMDVWGLPNVERYKKIENFLIEGNKDE